MSLWDKSSVFRLAQSSPSSGRAPYTPDLDRLIFVRAELDMLERLVDGIWNMLFERFRIRRWVQLHEKSKGPEMIYINQEHEQCTILWHDEALEKHPKAKHSNGKFSQGHRNFTAVTLCVTNI